MLRLLVCFVLPFTDSGDTESLGGDSSLLNHIQHIYQTEQPAEVISLLNANTELLDIYIAKHQEFEIETGQITGCHFFSDPSLIKEEKINYSISYTLKTRNYTCLKIFPDNSYVYLDSNNKIKQFKTEDGVSAIISVPADYDKE